MAKDVEFNININRDIVGEAREVALKRIVLSRFDISMRQMINHRLDIKLATDYAMGEMVAELKTWFASNEIKRMQDDIEYVPVGLWDYIKIRLPNFIKKRLRTPNMRSIVKTTKFIHICPHVDIQRMENHIQFMTPTDLNSMRIQNR